LRVFAGSAGIFLGDGTGPTLLPPSPAFFGESGAATGSIEVTNFGRITGGPYLDTGILAFTTRRYNVGASITSDQIGIWTYSGFANVTNSAGIIHAGVRAVLPTSIAQANHRMVA
jgi:hypothetical protein